MSARSLLRWPRREQISELLGVILPACSPAIRSNCRSRSGGSSRSPSLNREARRIVETGLGTVWVEGEISNLSRPSSGHLYWSLKDAEAQVRCAMFRMATRGLGFELANGQQVLVRARASLYEARGEYQLVVDYVEEAGEGVLRRRFEELKRRLAAEGLFDAARKLPLPKLPRRIGVITSPTGAALRDVLIALRRAVSRYGRADLPDTRAGRRRGRRDRANARARRSARGLRRADPDSRRRLARGPLVVQRRSRGARDRRTELPIIVGVGHEIDFTIADFVADLRAPTPSQAAELAVPDQREWLKRFAGCEQQLAHVTRRRIATEQRHFAMLAHRLQRCNPSVQLRERAQRLDELEARLAPRARAAHRDAQAQARAARDGRRAREPGASACARTRALAHRAGRPAPRIAAASRAHAAALEARFARASVIEPARDARARLFDRHGCRRQGADGRGDVTRGAAIDVRLARGGLAATVDSSSRARASGRYSQSARSASSIASNGSARTLASASCVATNDQRCDSRRSTSSVCCSGSTSHTCADTLAGIDRELLAAIDGFRGRRQHFAQANRAPA